MQPRYSMVRLVFFMFFIFTGTAFSQSYSGRIVRVIEGDILMFKTPDSTFKIHLYGIDAPDIGQVFGTECIKYLKNYLGEDARINCIQDINQEGTSAFLYIKGNDINKLLVKNGYAWYNRLHCVNADLARAEQFARENKLGLWMNENPIPPWNFREGILAKPQPVDGIRNVLICTNNKDNRYHKKYCQELIRCHSNVIVILRRQARDLHMKPCKYCF